MTYFSSKSLTRGVVVACVSVSSAVSAYYCACESVVACCVQWESIMFSFFNSMARGIKGTSHESSVECTLSDNDGSHTPEQ